MAQSKSHKDLSASILEGSDEMFDFFCQPCSAKRHVEAVGYCQECLEYLCTTCIDYHGNLSATKHHNVLDKSAMPKTKTMPGIKHADVLTERCPKHLDKVLEYYCHTHSQLCCSVCLTLDHTSCSDKGYIPDMSGGIDKSQEYKQLTADLERLIRKITRSQEKIYNDRKHNEEYHSVALVNKKEFRTQMTEIIDRIDKDTNKEIDKFQQENASMIRNASKKCQTLLSDVKTMAVDLEKVAKSGNTNQLFVKTKHSGHRIAEMEKKINESGEYKITRYEFSHEEDFQQMVSTLYSLWSLSVREDYTPIKARYVREMNVKVDDDFNECMISGVAVLTNERVIVTDDRNNAVKLIDMKVDKVVSYLSLSSVPCDITEIKPNQFAVALGYKMNVVVISVSDVLSMVQIIKTRGALITGLCYNGSHFITACQRPGSVKIIDMSGKTLKTFSTGNDCETLFMAPQSVALSLDKDVFYVSDSGTNTITSMTLSGHVLWVYRHGELHYPLGVAVGNDGAVYVCSEGSHAVHQLTPRGDLSRIILGQKQGLRPDPGAIAYGSEDNMLYISSYNMSSDRVIPEQSNFIGLYKLE